MSGESDDLLYQSNDDGLLFSSLADNDDELDFTKEFFPDDINPSSELNVDSYNDMGGDDLIAEFGEDDAFPRLVSSDLDDAAAFGVDVEQKSTSAASRAKQNSFGNGQILPSYGNFQKPSINLSHMNSSFGGGIPEMYMQQQHRNGMAVLGSPTSPALQSGGMLSPGATSEKLNSLSLEHQMGYSPFRQSAYDVKGNVVGRGFKGAGGAGGPFSPGGVEKRFPSSPLSSPSVSQGNSNGISPYSMSTGGGQDMSGSGSSLIASSDVGMQHSSNSQSLHHHSSVDGASPRSLSNSSSAECSDGVDGMLVSDGNGGLKIQQNNKSLFLSQSALVHRLGSAVDSSGFVNQLDANGDGLRPLSMQLPSRSSAMQRSFSSHALGQLRSVAPLGHGNEHGANFSRIGTPVDAPSRLSNEGASPHMQPQLPELQNIHHIRPLMQSMRRVHSTGDIQTLNGMAGGGTSPSSLDRTSYEDGGFKIGRYTMEERKIRIHRYQQKRTQRNFNKKIKYACRKTLADSRPRVRGRFAKNDDVGEPLVKHESKDEDEEEDNLMYEEEEFFVDEDSSDLADVLGMNGVKLEHPGNKGIKLEHHHAMDRKQLLQT